MFNNFKLFHDRTISSAMLWHIIITVPNISHETDPLFLIADFLHFVPNLVIEVSQHAHHFGIVLQQTQYLVLD